MISKAAISNRHRAAVWMRGAFRLGCLLHLVTRMMTGMTGLIT